MAINSNYEVYSVGDCIGILYDSDTGFASFTKNGVWQGGDGDVANTTALTGDMMFAFGAYGATTFTVNFGATPFAHQAPGGYLCLVDTNMQ